MQHETLHGRASPATTLALAVRQATRILHEAGIDGAARDSRMLVAEATGLSALDILLEPHRPLSGPAAERLAQFVARRRAREPVSRIMGWKGFYGRDFEISPAVLDPRPDTETLVGAALSIAAEEGWTEAPIRVLDIGTGSGCILVTMLAELPQATGLGTDISGPALAIARANACRHGVAQRAAWQQARSLAGVGGRFDLIVSNPPYVASAGIDRLEREVSGFDPHVALDGGGDGLDIYREIISGLPHVLESGWIVFEVGHEQARIVDSLVGELLPAESLSEHRTYLDLAGRPRCVAWKARI
jgi:release factor glutamine methyltransferase